jgi:hypothetical protein
LIVAVGHGDLTPVTLELVEAELRARVERLGEGATGLVLAGQVRLMALDPADRNACIGAGERLVAAGDTVLAVRDGGGLTAAE